MTEVLILPTGTANLASVRAAFQKLGASTRLASEPDMIRRAGHVVLPGVGTFGATMAGLRQAGLDQAITERIGQASPTLGMCVGLQVMFEASAESPGIEGLGAVKGQIEQFSDGVRVPQFGWNHVEPEPGCRYLQPGYAYFANSYRVQAAPGCKTAIARHGEPYIAAFEHGDVLACQFHPELSGAFGHRLIQRWLEG
ncbi:MAG: imidazole glycerol phosphate synthase subunit HisH [Geminicoccaceae bacterium]